MFIRLLIGGILTLSFFYLETIDLSKCYDDKGQFLSSLPCAVYQFSLDYRFILAFTFVSIYIGLNLALDRKDNSKVRNNIHDILDVFFDTRLDNNKEEIRITVFKRVGFFRALLYFLKTTALKFRYYLKTNKMKVRLKTFPLPFSEYLIAHTRFGLPNQDIKSTIFCIKKNHEDTNSFAEYVFHCGKTKFEELPDVSDIDLLNVEKIDDIDTSDKKNRIREYMRVSQIKNFEKFRMFSRRSQYIGGIPLYVKKRSMNKPSHLIVYDSTTKAYSEISKQLERLAKYIEVILINK